MCLCFCRGHVKFLTFYAGFRICGKFKVYRDSVGSVHKSQ